MKMKTFLKTLGWLIALVALIVIVLAGIYGYKQIQKNSAGNGGKSAFKSDHSGQKDLSDQNLGKLPLYNGGSDTSNVKFSTENPSELARRVARVERHIAGIDYDYQALAIKLHKFSAYKELFMYRDFFAGRSDLSLYEKQLRAGMEVLPIRILAALFAKLGFTPEGAVDYLISAEKYFISDYKRCLSRNRGLDAAISCGKTSDKKFRNFMVKLNKSMKYKVLTTYYKWFASSIPVGVTFKDFSKNKQLLSSDDFYLSVSKNLPGMSSGRYTERPSRLVKSTTKTRKTKDIKVSVVKRVEDAKKVDKLGKKILKKQEIVEEKSDKKVAVGNHFKKVTKEYETTNTQKKCNFSPNCSKSGAKK